MKSKHISKTFVRQLERTDCGPACLRSVLRFYGSDASFEHIRSLSGTSPEGTSLLGLYQAAQESGLEVEGYEGSIEALDKIEDLAILHVIVGGKLQHYLLYYGRKNGKYILGDPAKGIGKYTEEDLEEIWQTKTLLCLRPGPDFQMQNTRSQKWTFLKNILVEYNGILGVIVFLGLLAASLSLTMAVFSQQLIDNILPSGNHTTLFVGIGLVAFLLLTKNGIVWLRGLLLNRQSMNFNNGLINHFYEQLLYLPKMFFDSRKTGELVTRLNDTQRIQRIISYMVGETAVSFLVLVVSWVMLFQYHAVLALTSLLVLPTMGFLVWIFHKPIATSQKETMQAFAFTENHYIESIKGIETIKIAHQESVFAQKTRLIYGDFQDKLYELGKIRIGFKWLLDGLSVFFLVWVLAYGSYEVIEKKLLLGEFMAVLSVSSNLFPAAAGLLLTYIQLQEAKVAFDRMFELTAVEQEDTGTEQSSNQIFESQQIKVLEIRNLSFRFPGGLPLFENFNFIAEKGQVNVLRGENGRGKSTLMQIIQRFYKPEKGQILLNSQDADNFPLGIWRENLGVMLQNVHVFSGTVWENIGFHRTSDSADVIAFCKKTGLEEFILKMPQAYGTVIGEGGVHLSGGQKQIVGLARALFGKPKVILLDEPTSAMDDYSRHLTNSLIKKIAKEVVVILITHRDNLSED